MLSSSKKSTKLSDVSDGPVGVGLGVVLLFAKKEPNGDGGDLVGGAGVTIETRRNMGCLLLAGFGLNSDTAGDDTSLLGLNGNLGGVAWSSLRMGSPVLMGSPVASAEPV